MDALLGSPARDWGTSATYETDHEGVVAKYSDGGCDATIADWNVPKGTLVELTVNPNPSFLLKELHLDPHRYRRYELSPYPETDNPPKVWNYLDDLNGITIRTQSSRGGGEGEELVVSIIYRPSKADEKLRCNTNAEFANRKP